jgi:hypothetical protein
VRNEVLLGRDRLERHADRVDLAADQCDLGGSNRSSAEDIPALAFEATNYFSVSLAIARERGGNH